MIQSTSHSNGYNRLDALTNNSNAAKTTPPIVANTDKSDRLSSANTDALRAALNSTPEVRAEAVKRGRELLADMNYPPREIIANLAKMMVNAPDQTENA